MLLTKTEFMGFNTEEICRGTLICARHKTWPEWQTGMVTDVSEDLVRVQYLPTIQNVQNHYMIPCAEVEAGEWEVRYSPDLESIFTYIPENTEGKDEENVSG